MAFQIDNTAQIAVSDPSHTTKRRRFAPGSLPAIIPSSDNSSIEYHTFNSPLLAQLCEQMPTQEEIEASLLQVGMRVRKSINDGYQTQKKFTPHPFRNNLHRLSPETQQALLGTNQSSYNSAPAGNCMAIQPLSTATFCGINLAMLSYKSDDWSNPEIKQQTLWQYSTSFKRGCDADSDSDDSQEWQPETPTLTAEAGHGMPMDYFNIGIENSSNISPFTQLSEETRQGFGSRKMAKPRTRIREQPELQEAPMPPTTINPFVDMSANQPETHFNTSIQSPILSGHTRMRSCGMDMNLNMNDFGEATFLRPREDVEMDCS